METLQMFYKKMVLFIFACAVQGISNAATVTADQTMVIEFNLPTNASGANVFAIQLNAGFGPYTGLNTMQLFDGTNLLGTSSKNSSGAIAHYFSNTEGASVFPIPTEIIDFSSISNGTMDLVAKLTINNGAFTPSSIHAFFWHYDELGNPTTLATTAPSSVTIVPSVNTDSYAVPEPTTIALMSLGIAGMAAYRRHPNLHS